MTTHHVPAHRLRSFLRRFMAFSFIGPFLGRVVIGIVFMQSGYGKLTHLPKTVEFFASLGIPYPNLQAHLVASIELLSGALVASGLATRLASIPLVMIMGVALKTARWEDFTDLASLFSIPEFLYAVILLGLISTGPGVFSIDALLRGKLCSKDLG